MGILENENIFTQIIKFYNMKNSILRYFRKESLPTSNEAELPDAVTREANKAVENILRRREATELVG